jgi:hypothetical protein
VVALLDVMLSSCYRLMRRAPGAESIAVLGERPIPVLFQNLLHHLLDHAVQDRRDAQLAHPSARFGNLPPQYRLR